MSPVRFQREASRGKGAAVLFSFTPPPEHFSKRAPCRVFRVPERRAVRYGRVEPAYGQSWVSSLMGADWVAPCPRSSCTGCHIVRNCSWCLQVPSRSTASVPRAGAVFSDGTKQQCTQAVAFHQGATINVQQSQPPVFSQLVHFRSSRTAHRLRVLDGE